MGSREFEAILDECLDRIISHGESVDRCLERYPDHATELEPLLRAALSAQEIRLVEPRREFRQAARGRLLSRIAEKREAQSRSRLPRLSWGRRCTVAVTLVLALLLMGAGTVGASSGSLPGDALYPVKTAAEKVQAFFTFGEEARAEFHAMLAERRINEIVALAESRRAIAESVVKSMSSQTNRALSLASQNAGSNEELAESLVQLTAKQKKVMVALVGTSAVETKAQLRKALQVLEAAHRRAVLLKASLPQGKNDDKGAGPTSDGASLLDEGGVSHVGGTGGASQGEQAHGWSAPGGSGSQSGGKDAAEEAVLTGGELQELEVEVFVGEKLGNMTDVSSSGAAANCSGPAEAAASKRSDAGGADCESGATAVPGTGCESTR
jgi:hypothetical protein